MDKFCKFAALVAHSNFTLTTFNDLAGIFEGVFKDGAQNVETNSQNAINELKAVLPVMIIAMSLIGELVL